MEFPSGAQQKATAAGLRVSHIVVVTATFAFPAPPCLTRSNPRRWR